MISNRDFALAVALHVGTHSMSDRVFLDTNILLYAYDVDAGNKHRVARDLVRGLWNENTGVLSTQVLQEFYVNVTAKIPTPLSPARARSVLRNYLAWHVETNSAESVLMASEVQEQNRLSFWDALIIVAASNAGASVLYSEDLNHDQMIEGVRVCNPFFDSTGN